MAKTPDVRAQNVRFVAFLQAWYFEVAGPEVVRSGLESEESKINNSGPPAPRLYLSKPGHFLPFSATFDAIMKSADNVSEIDPCEHDWRGVAFESRLSHQADEKTRPFSAGGGFSDAVPVRSNSAGPSQIFPISITESDNQIFGSVTC
jgi:hypothetical protein